MNIYIDESGSINNHIPNNKYFVIALVHVFQRESLKRAYKRFVSSNYDRLFRLDAQKSRSKPKGKMFSNGKFKELKGTQFDRNMKQRFVEFFSRRQLFELYYIRIANEKLDDHFCENTARVFNYTIKLALDYFIQNGYLPNEDCDLQLDERNEKTETKYFLENYLNTELAMSGTYTGNFNVTYFDSTNNTLIQLADVFANLYFSHLKTGNYSQELQTLREAGILKFIFDFPK